jgi:hypothetical protein
MRPKSLTSQQKERCFDKRMLAYKAHDGDEGWAIVFATSNASARRLAASEMDCDFEAVEFCRRERQLDRYAPGPVPKIALIDSGWWFECYGCGRRIESDAYDVQGVYAALSPVENGSLIYCSEICKADHEAERAAAKAVEAAGIATVTAYLIARVPEARVTRTHGYACRNGAAKQLCLSQAFVEFMFPGGKYGGIARYEQRDFYREKAITHLAIAHGDLPAWHDYAAKREVDLGIHRWADDGGCADA